MRQESKPGEAREWTDSSLIRCLMQFRVLLFPEVPELALLDRRRWLGIRKIRETALK
jgi:hypothetical protein